MSTSQIMSQEDDWLSGPLTIIPLKHSVSAASVFSGASADNLEVDGNTCPMPTHTNDPGMMDMPGAINFKPVSRDLWLEVLMPLEMDEYQKDAAWPLLWVDSFCPWGIYAAHPASKVSVGGDLCISLLLKCHRKAWVLLKVLNNHLDPDSWAMIPGRAVMQQHEVHHMLAPFLSHIELQYVAIAHEEACSLSELDAWLDPSFAPPHLTCDNMAGILLDYKQFPPFVSLSQDPPPLHTMVCLSFTTDTIRDFLNQNNTLLMQKVST